MIIYEINKLKPLEKVFPNHLSILSNMIKSSTKVLSPIIADKETGIILDGSHRYIFFLKEGYLTVPVKLIDYKDEHIRVGTHLMHRHIIDSDPGISKNEVIKRGLTGNTYPPRTTRHFFPFRKNVNANVNLSDLLKGDPVDVSKYIANVSIEHEINHNLNYLDEIDFEMDEIIKYLDEIRMTKLYLKNQIKAMRKQ